MSVIAPEHRVVLIRIPKTAPTDGDPAALYKATREWWTVGEPRTVPGPHAPTHALAVVKGQVVAAYEIHGWEQRHDRKRRFEGVPARDEMSRYVGADVSTCFTKGSQNPLRYVNCEGSAPLPLVIDRPAEPRGAGPKAPGWATTRYTQPWVQAADAADRQRAALEVAALATFRGIHQEMRQRLLKELLWFMTEWTGKYGTRFRSLEALDLQATEPAGSWRKKVAHEHVLTKRSLAEELLATEDSDQARWEVLRRSVACVVTRDEHKRLTGYDKTHTGWERYVAAGISVVDMATGEVLTPADIAASLLTVEG